MITIRHTAIIAPDYDADDKSNFFQRLSDGETFYERMLVEHPLPQPQNAEVSEVFGPIVFEEDLFYQKYDSVSRNWAIILAQPNGRELKSAGSGVSSKEAELINGLGRLPPPDFAVYLDGQILDSWTYRGRSFSWCWDRADAQWRLYMALGCNF